LIAETVPSVEWLDMPAEEGVASPGWDGVVECPVGNQFMPAGRSVWEQPTAQKNAHSKACKDYDKRRENTPPGERAELTYVAVGCAPWTSRIRQLLYQPADVVVHRVGFPSGVSEDGHIGPLSEPSFVG